MCLKLAHIRNRDFYKYLEVFGCTQWHNITRENYIHITENSFSVSLNQLGECFGTNVLECKSIYFLTEYNANKCLSIKIKTATPNL